MQIDISKLNTVQIEPYNITNGSSVLYGVFPTMIKNKCDSVKYDIADQFELSNLPAIGFDDGLYYFYYKIKTKDDIITNIKVKKSQKIKLKFNYNFIDIDENFKVYPFLLNEQEISICVFYSENETAEQFKISYTGYTLNYGLKQKLISENLNFSHIREAPRPITDYSSVYYTVCKLKNTESEDLHLV